MNEIKPEHKPVSLKDPLILIALWFGCGLMKPGPGTWGTIGALPIGILLLVFGGWPVLLLAALAISVIGYFAAKRYEEQSGVHDASQVVVDEVAGMWIALIPAALTPISVITAFILFRFFDILKPWPVGWADKNLPGATGVMTDDILAGIIAALILVGLQYAGILG